jgi:hypothetical protein
MPYSHSMNNILVACVIAISVTALGCHGCPLLPTPVDGGADAGSQPLDGSTELLDASTPADPVTGLDAGLEQPPVIMEPAP